MTLTATRTHSEFTEFYSASFARIAAQLYAYLGDYSEAQDLTQEAFCRAYDRWDRVAVFADPAGWVRRVAWNLATSRLRHLQAAKRYLSWQRIEHVGGPSPDRVALVRALSELPPKHRLAVVLHYIGDLSTAEIAAQRQVSEGTVRSWLSRGRSQLAEQLTDPHWTETVTAPGAEHVVRVVRRRRVIRRSAIAAAIVVALTVPVALIARARGNEPPIIGPTAPPTPVPSRTPAPNALTECQGAPLPVPPGAEVTRFAGGEPTGRYLVGDATRTTDRVSWPVVWSDGNVTVIPAPGGGLDGLAVNSHGLIAGSNNVDAERDYKIWTFRDGRLEILFSTNDMQKSLRVIDVNNRGDLLLSRFDGKNPAVFSGGQMRKLTLPAGVANIYVREISDDGTVVGTSNDARALVWSSDGSVRELFGPPGRMVTVSDIRGGFASGHVLAAQGQTSAIGWNLATGDYTLYPDLDEVADVTKHGWMLAHVAGSSHTWVIQMGDLRLVLPPNHDSGSRFISDDGRVIAGTTPSRAYVWTCQ